MLEGIIAASALLSMILAFLGRNVRMSRLRYPGWLCFAVCLFCMLLDGLPWTHMLLLSLLLTSVSAWRKPNEL